MIDAYERNPEATSGERRGWTSPKPPPVRRWKEILALLALAVLLAWLLSEPDGVQRGVTLDGVVVGGLTYAQLRRVAAERGGARQGGTVEVACGGMARTVTFDSLGAEVEVEPAVCAAWLNGREPNLLARAASRVRGFVSRRDLPFGYRCDPGKAHALARRFRQAPRNARFTTDGRSGGEPRILPEQAGFRVDEAAAADAIRDGLAHGEGRIEIPFRPIPPEWTAADLEPLTHVLAHHSTPIRTRSTGSRNNIRIAAGLLDSAVVPPGGTFSFNRRLGPRTEERGFRNAPIMLSGGKISADMAGGICQLSSTCFIAAVYAGFRILERHPHSKPVRFCKPGWDAAVFLSGGKDFVFKNTSPSSVAVRLWVGGNRVHCEIRSGMPPAEKVHLADRVEQRTGRLKVRLYRFAGGRAECVATSTYIMKGKG